MISIRMASVLETVSTIRETKCNREDTKAITCTCLIKQRATRVALISLDASGRTRDRVVQRRVLLAN